MREFSLCKELSMKLCKDIGATPLSFSNTGLTITDLLSDIKLHVSDEDGEIKNVPVWYGEAKGSEDTLCCLLAGLDTNPESLEIACVIGMKSPNGDFQDDGIRISFHFDWSNDEDPGTMVMKAGEDWVQISLAQRLQLILGFEIMIQDGVVWQKSLDIPGEIQKDLSEAIEVD